MLAIFKQCLKHDLLVMQRHRAEWVQPLVFFIIFISLFGIGLGFEGNMLITVAPAIIWISFLLTSLFSIESIFRRELEAGLLENLVLSPHPLWWLLFVKALAIWVMSCLPLILLMPLLGLFMQLNLIETGVLLLSVLIASPAITLMGMLGATLTLALPRSGVFLGILLLPLYIPILILGESAVVLLLSGAKPLFQMALLSAISVLTLTLIPHAAAGALKIAMD